MVEVRLAQLIREKLMAAHSWGGCLLGFGVGAMFGVGVRRKAKKELMAFSWVP